MAEYKKQHFNSLGEFYNYISITKENSVFEGKTLTSLDTSEWSKGFTLTNSFETAVELMRNGWSEMAKDIEGKLQAKIKNISNKSTQRSVYDVVGGNCSVPRYLQGVPTNMINKKRVVQKQKVVTLNKFINYSASASTEQIVDESVKALIIVREIEAAGIRVNLNIVLEAQSGNEIASLSIRIKNASERLNVSKVAFPLVHPSMLRRLSFRWMEVSSVITEKGFIGGYGSPLNERKSKEYMNKNEIMLPSFIRSVEEVVASI